MSKYDNIINYDYQMKHERMSLKNRSAQFAPFSALTGYSEMIEENNRVTLKKRELTDEEKDILNKKLIMIKKNIKNKPVIKIKYFIKDNKKDGGKYLEIKDNIKKINDNKIYLLNSMIVNIDDIINIDSDELDFNNLDNML